MNLIKTYKKLEEQTNTPTIYDLKPYYEIVDRINVRYQEIRILSEAELKTLNVHLKTKPSQELPDEEKIIESFALIKVVAQRVLGLEAFDVQLITALALYEGRITEMKTGEGKTLAALFATYLRAIEGKGIHVHTFNEYLATRDFENFKPVFRFLELEAACLKDEMGLMEVQRALIADITYGSAKQFIYTYLKFSISDDFQFDFESRFHYAIIDEADAILLDEATNPFVIAGNNHEYSEDFYKIAKAVKLLVKAELFSYTDFKRGVYLMEEGISFS